MMMSADGNVKHLTPFKTVAVVSFVLFSKIVTTAQLSLLMLFLSSSLVVWCGPSEY